MKVELQKVNELVKAINSSDSLSIVTNIKRTDLASDSLANEIAIRSYHWLCSQGKVEDFSIKTSVVCKQFLDNGNLVEANKIYATGRMGPRRFLFSFIFLRPPNNNKIFRLYLAPYKN